MFIIIKTLKQSKDNLKLSAWAIFKIFKLFQYSFKVHYEN